MNRNLAQDLRTEPRALVLARSIERVDLAHLRARATEFELTPRRRARALRAALIRFRIGHRRLWGPILLDLMAPAIVSRVGRFRPQPPAISEEDIAQQLVLEVLIAAATMPFEDPPRFVERQLAMRAAWRVSRWLTTMRLRQAYQIPLLEVGNDDA